MKSTKSYLSFSSVLALVALILLLLFFTPCFDVKQVGSNTLTQINLFHITFGHLIAAPTFAVRATPGMICAFSLIILGIILAIAKNRFKLFGFLSFMSFTASGILVLLSRTMAYYASKEAIGTGLGTQGNIYQTGWVYAIGSLLIIVGAFALFDAIASLSKPKAKEVY